MHLCSGTRRWCPRLLPGPGKPAVVATSPFPNWVEEHDHVRSGLLIWQPAYVLAAGCKPMFALALRLTLPRREQLS